MCYRRKRSAGRSRNLKSKRDAAAQGGEVAVAVGAVAVVAGGIDIGGRNGVVVDIAALVTAIAQLDTEAQVLNHEAVEYRRRLLKQSRLR